MSTSRGTETFTGKVAFVIGAGGGIGRATEQGARGARPQPWVPPARTGWAAKQKAGERRTDGCECGEPFGSCAGCGEPRCLTCDPYRSDDCRWSI